MADPVATHPVTGATLYFDADAHRYFCGPPADRDAGALCSDLRELASVTRFVKRYFPAFDAPAAAARVAARENRPVAAVLAEWETKGAASCRLGTRVHQVAEDAFHGRAPRHAPESERERVLMAVAWQTVDDMRPAGWELVAAEAPIFSDRLGLAGTIDLAVRHPNGYLALCDWKTNETIDAAAKYGEKGLGPCAGLDDCSLVRYALQLQTYSSILALDGWTESLPACLLLHVTPGGIACVELPDLFHVVNAMLLDLQLNPLNLEA